MTPGDYDGVRIFQVPDRLRPRSAASLLDALRRSVPYLEGEYDAVQSLLTLWHRERGGERKISAQEGRIVAVVPGYGVTIIAPRTARIAFCTTFCPLEAMSRDPAAVRWMTKWLSELSETVRPLALRAVVRHIISEDMRRVTGVMAKERKRETKKL